MTAGQLDDELTAAFGDRLQRGVSLTAYTTYRVGGPARWFVEVTDERSVERLGDLVARTGVPVLAVGLGSNLLVADAGFDGLVVRLGGGFAAIALDGTTVVAGAAAKLPVVARTTVAAGLTGFEWAVGVPGTIGGAVRMNAGGHGSDMASSLESIRVLDLDSGKDERMAASALDLGYRSSALGPADLVLDAHLRLEAGSVEDGAALIREIVAWRREHQPGGANAGSVFTNPEGDSAGRLIEAAGLKGRRVGSAWVSTRHANFIQVDEGGRAADVLELLTQVRDAVVRTAGVDLEVETRIVGFGPEVDQR